MKTYYKLFSIFILIIILSFCSCFDSSDDDNGSSSGTVSVTLTGAAAFNTETFYFSIFSQSDLVNAQGFNSFTINAGGGSGTIQSGGADLSLSNGTYIMTCFIDEDGNTDPNDPSVDPGDDYTIFNVTVNGDTTVDLTYPTDFTIE